MCRNVTKFRNLIPYLPFYLQDLDASEGDGEDIHVREERLAYFRSKTNSEALDESSEAEALNTTAPQDKSLGAAHYDDELLRDTVSTPNENEDVMDERNDAGSDRAGSSPAESQLEDIDIEQCDFVSEESKISPEDELIELLKAASVGTSPEDSRENLDEVQADQFYVSLMEEGGLPEEDNKHNLEELDTNVDTNTDWKSDAESDSSDDIIERFEASLNHEKQHDLVNLAREGLRNKEEDDEKNESNVTAEEHELEDSLLTDTSTNIDELVTRLGEIENEISASEHEEDGIREGTKRSSDEEFEEIERLLYEEKARIAAEQNHKQLEETLDDSSDEEFKQLEKALYEQNARNEAESRDDESNGELTRTASDEEFEQLEKLANKAEAQLQAQQENELEKKPEASKQPLSPTNLPFSPKTVEEDDLLDIIGSGGSDVSLSSEDEGENLGEVGKLILAQSSDDRETLGSDEEKASDRNVTWSVSVRTSAPVPPISAPVMSEQNVAFVSTCIIDTLRVRV